jgi:hypothetical protein
MMTTVRLHLHFASRRSCFEVLFSLCLSLSLYLSLYLSLELYFFLELFLSRRSTSNYARRSLPSKVCIACLSRVQYGPQQRAHTSPTAPKLNSPTAAALSPQLSARRANAALHAARQRARLGWLRSKITNMQNPDKNHLQRVLLDTRTEPRGIYHCK